MIVPLLYFDCFEVSVEGRRMPVNPVNVALHSSDLRTAWQTVGAVNSSMHSVVKKLSTEAILIGNESYKPDTSLRASM